MRLSRYNFIEEYKNEHIFFNARTCALATVNQDFLRIYSGVDKGSYSPLPEDEPLLRDMVRSGCIIEDDVDELQIVTYKRNLGVYNQSTLYLTIAPTLACNFRCTYCFERHSADSMTKQTQTALLQFVEKRISRLKELGITWYGGEPLLAKETMDSLSCSMIRMCEDHGIKYKAAIITNGSLLDDEGIEFLRRLRISFVQITLDGPPKIHDTRRHSMNGKSTFSTIIANINKLLQTDIEIGLRVNIDKSNSQNVEDLLRILKAEVSGYQKIKIGFAQVVPVNDICQSVQDDCFDAGQFSEYVLPLYSRALAEGFDGCKMLLYPSTKYNYCGADWINSFVIDPNGDLYKCWSLVGDKKRRVETSKPVACRKVRLILLG